METILIGDTVTCTVEDYEHKGKSGVVVASKRTNAGIEHQVEFPPRKWTPEEIDAGEDVRSKGENIVWLLANEVEKVSVDET